MITPDLPVNRFLERETSWLAFNRRVLDMARDADRVTLLERVNFLSIFSSNLDEFFMVRVAGLKRRIDAGVATPSVSGLMPRDLFDLLLATVRDDVALQYETFADIRGELAEAGVHLVYWDDLDTEERERTRRTFSDRIFPILTPLAIDSAHPFPLISSLGLNLAVILRDPHTGERQFVRIKIPNMPDLPRCQQVSPNRWVTLEEIVFNCLDDVFTGQEIVGRFCFRVTRSEELEIEEDDAESILTALEAELLRNRVGSTAVRLEISADADPAYRDMLRHELGLSEREVFELPEPLDLTGLSAISGIDRDDLHHPGFLPRTNADIAMHESARPADVFAAIRRGDILLHHPYDSFATSVQRFIEQAAHDPQVLAIKQTLYRTSGDSPIVDALIDAARAGKQVLAVVEIKARFDERANISWARKMEQNGVHVVYGMVGLKTHAKLCLVVRSEGGSLRRYCHIGTGNYHPSTARLYEDMGLMTCNPLVTEDVAHLFNHLSGITGHTEYTRLLVAPHGVRFGLLQVIEQERAKAIAGEPARIRIKVNSLVDETIIDALYTASMAGVQIDIWCRGICALRPGVPGLSETIRVRSILGRFLEHSRIFVFGAQEPAVGIGSADLMHRNLDRRVEAIVLLTQKRHVDYVERLFELAFDPATAGWDLDGRSGQWRQSTHHEDGRPKRDLHQLLADHRGVRRGR